MFLRMSDPHSAVRRVCEDSPSRLLAGIPVEDRVNIFINSFGSIQETTMVRIAC